MQYSSIRPSRMKVRARFGAADQHQIATGLTLEPLMIWATSSFTSVALPDLPHGATSRVLENTQRISAVEPASVRDIVARGLRPVRGGWPVLLHHLVCRSTKDCRIGGFRYAADVLPHLVVHADPLHISVRS